jgi:Mce-associated membrane protein
VAGARRRPSADAPAASTLVLPPHAAHGRPVDVKPSTSEPEEASEQAGTRRRTVGAGVPGRLLAPAIGASLALALLAASLVYALRPSVSDTDRTAAVGSARTTLESLLSYSGAAFDKHIGEVTPQLASPFKDQFTKVAATDIKPMAVKNDATVQAKVYDAGVMDSTGDGGEGTTVRVMAFVNQATTTKAQQAPAIDQNRVIATMRKVGDRWLISELSAY